MVLVIWHKLAKDWHYTGAIKKVIRVKAPAWLACHRRLLWKFMDWWPDLWVFSRAEWLDRLCLSLQHFSNEQGIFILVRKREGGGLYTLALELGEINPKFIDTPYGLYYQTWSFKPSRIWNWDSTGRLFEISCFKICTYTENS